MDRSKFFGKYFCKYSVAFRTKTKFMQNKSPNEHPRPRKSECMSQVPTPEQSSRFNIEIPLKLLSMFFLLVLPWLQVRSEFLFESPSIKPKFNNVAVPTQTFDETRDDDLLFSSIIWHCFQSSLSLKFFKPISRCEYQLSLLQKGSTGESYRQPLFLLMFLSRL